MEGQLQEFTSEHSRLLELKNAPKQLELEAERLRATLQAQEARLRRLDEQVALAEVEENGEHSEVKKLETTVRQLQAQIESQACTKKDIERLRCERGHLSEMLKDLRSDTERVEQEVWELGIQETKLIEAIDRASRRVNEAIEPRGGLFSGIDTTGQDLSVHLDLSEPTEALPMKDFADARMTVQTITATHIEALPREEAAFNEVRDEQRIAQEELSEKDQECCSLKVRLEQLAKRREEYRVCCASQLDDAQRAAEAAEDAANALLMGPSTTLRDSAEVDKLRLKLVELRATCASDKAEFEEQLSWEENRGIEYRNFVLKEMGSVVKMMDALKDELGAALNEDVSDSPDVKVPHPWRSTPCTGTQ